MQEDFQEQIKPKTTDELLLIYKNPDEYQQSFIELVEQELKNRNVQIEDHKAEKELNALHTQEKFMSGKPGNQLYITLCLISGLFGGIIGIIGGYIYSQSKHSDNEGNKYYVYDSKTRKLGRIMMIVGVFALLLLLIWKFN